MVTRSTFAGRALRSSDSCAAVEGTSPLDAQLSTLASSERLLGEEHGVTTCSCLASHILGDRVRPGCCSPAVHLSDDLPLYNRSTIDGRTLGSSESRAIIIGTSPRIARVSLASDPDNLTSSELEWASQDRCFFQLPWLSNWAPAFGPVISSGGSSPSSVHSNFNCAAGGYYHGLRMRDNR
jgi:hypothetical protein